MGCTSSVPSQDNITETEATFIIEQFYGESGAAGHSHFLYLEIGGDNPLDKAKLPPIKRVLAADPGEEISVTPLSPKKLPKLNNRSIEEMEGESSTADDDTSLEDLSKSVKDILAN